MRLTVTILNSTNLDHGSWIWRGYTSTRDVNVMLTRSWSTFRDRNCHNGKIVHYLSHHRSFIHPFKDHY